ncbi:MAG: low molecular weight phosphotyrosine protein phosphatase [Bdellovibrionales bacterium]|nr:low molecular weight phosphotyrosine protein phosphatase [Bdellovibrionales bacterium]
MSSFNVLFVCLGNICRSPLAEGVFRQRVEEAGLSENISIDSCGTGSWHIGKPPHRESQKVALKHGIDISNQRARQLQVGDAQAFHLLVAMDRENREDILAVCGKDAHVECLRYYDSDQSALDVPDPYYGGPEGFQEVFDIIDRCATNLLKAIQEKQKF